MPKIGVSYDQVAAVADSLVAEGVNPSIRKVMERLKTGSGTTIHRHMTRWRNERQTPVAVTSDLPVAVCSAIHAEIERAKAEVRAEFENRLVICQEEANDLAALGKSLEDQLDKLTEEFDAVSAERETLVTKLEKQSATIELLNRDIERERYGCELARTETAEVRITLNVQNEKIQALNNTNTRLQSENSIILNAHHELECRVASMEATLVAADEKSKALAETQAGLNAEIERLQIVAATESMAKTDAEKTVAVLTAKLESEQQKSKDLLAENQSIMLQLQAERESGESVRIISAEVSKENKIQSVQLSELNAGISELTRQLEVERSATIEVKSTIAVLTARLGNWESPRESHTDRDISR